MARSYLVMHRNRDLRRWLDPWLAIHLTNQSQSIMVPVICLLHGTLFVKVSRLRANRLLLCMITMLLLSPNGSMTSLTPAWPACPRSEPSPPGIAQRVKRATTPAAASRVGRRRGPSPTRIGHSNIVTIHKYPELETHTRMRRTGYLVQRCVLHSHANVLLWCPFAVRRIRVTSLHVVSPKNDPMKLTR